MSLFYLVYFLIFVFTGLIGVSIYSARMNNFMADQFKKKAERALLLEIDAEHEQDFKKARSLIQQAEAIKKECAIILGKHPKIKRQINKSIVYQMGLSNLNTASAVTTGSTEPSLGQLLEKYSQQHQRESNIVNLNNKR